MNAWKNVLPSKDFGEKKTKTKTTWGSRCWIFMFNLLLLYLRLKMNRWSQALLLILFFFSRDIHSMKFLLCWTEYYGTIYPEVTFMLLEYVYIVSNLCVAIKINILWRNVSEIISWLRHVQMMDSDSDVHSKKVVFFTWGKNTKASTTPNWQLHNKMDWCSL